MTGYHVSAKVAQQKLSSFFASNLVRIKTTGQTGARERILVCLMDELDFLLTRDFRVIYNLFDWSMHERSGFLLISISNTMDLPERISARYFYFILSFHHSICSYRHLVSLLFTFFIEWNLVL